MKQHHHSISLSSLLLSFVSSILISFFLLICVQQQQQQHQTFCLSFVIVRSNSHHTYRRSNNNVRVPLQLQQHQKTTSEQQQLNKEFVENDINVQHDKLQTIILDNLYTLSHQGSDIRGTYVDTGDSVSDITAIATAIEQQASTSSSSISGSKKGGVPALSPFAAYCFGYAFVQQLLDVVNEQQQNNDNDNDTNTNTPLIIGVGHDSRIHGLLLANALIQGLQNSSKNVQIKYLGIATTPSCAAFCRMKLVHAAVMITASHLPPDRNGFKLFSGPSGAGYNKQLLHDLGTRAQQYASNVLFSSTRNIQLGSNNNNNNIIPGEHVQDWMAKYYAASLKKAIRSKVHCDSETTNDKPLSGLTIVLNSGNGAGGFFAHHVLEDLGANTVQVSLHLQPDGTFPNGVPNPELSKMVTETIEQCQKVKADLGILLDTDADRCGFVVPCTTTSTDDNKTLIQYEPLNRNRLIALLSVIFAKESPGCAIVTDSVTSEGLASFLTENLKLNHVRYLKGYANVIKKAIDLTNSGIADAKMAIETSGHCAMQENGYLDDGTYTAVQIVSLLARNREISLLDLISDMKELPIVEELRMNAKDGSLKTMEHLFDICYKEIETAAAEGTSTPSWEIDTENLEGIRVRFGTYEDGQFFMLRKSLHDPIISLQVEAKSIDIARTNVIQPLLNILNQNPEVQTQLDMSVVSKY